ncbi:MAG TPA: RodZ domain-containing protein [Candidatus Acidoferrales bacterium]|jgi:cytoskeleton protein RodZ|nr:RodZ domain-containing protein [Candidatus Acidoferrales bacterium]
MKSVGETLRAERLKRNLAIDQISRELKISSRFLTAIETGEFNKLPGGVFTKSFVRQYARMLGLDEEELAGQVQRVLEPLPEVLQLAAKAKASESEFHVPKMEEWERVGESRFRWSGSISAAAILVVALLICSGVYRWMQRPHIAETAPTSAPPVSSSAAPPVSSTAAPPVAVPETAAAPPNRNPSAQPPPEPVAAAPPASTPPQSSTPLSQVAQADRNATVHVAVTAVEAVWILVRIDGKYSFSGTLEANQTRTVETSGTVLLRLGNAGSVNITLNGKPIGEVGPKGQVRTVQLTSGGFQIVPAKPPAALEPL